MTTLSIGGMGGFECGLRAAGIDVRPVGFCEREKLAAAVLRREWPSAAMYREIGEINVKRRSIDVICGKLGSGDFQLAGARQRVAPTAGRGDWLARLIRSLEPEWALLEIERELLTAGGGDRMQSFLAQIAGWLPPIPRGKGRDGWGTGGFIKPAQDYDRDCGATFGAAWQLLDLQCFSDSNRGHRQQRERLYVVLRRAAAPAAEVFLDEEDLVRIFDQGEEGGQGASDAVLDANPPNVIGYAEIPFVWRAGGHNRSPIVARDTLPTISGDNVAIADPTMSTVRRLLPEEVEFAYTLRCGWTAQGIKTTVRKGPVRIEIKDATRYRMLGRDTVPPAIVEWIASRIWNLAPPQAEPV